MVTSIAIAPSKETLAIHYLEDLVYDYVFSEVEPISTPKVIGMLGDKKTYNQQGIRQLLSKSRRLTYIDRRWHLVARHRLRRKPTEGILRAVLEAYGKPLSVELIAREFSILHSRPEERFRNVLEDLLPSLSDEYVFVGKDLVALQSWFLELPEDPETPYDAVLSLEDSAAMDALYEAGDNPLREDEESLVDYVGRLNSVLEGPVSNTLLGYLLWKERAQLFHPTAGFAELVQTPGLMLLSGCLWCGEELVTELKGTLAKTFEARRKTAKGGEKPLDIATIMTEDDGRREAISDSELAQVNSTLAATPEGMSLEEIVSSVFEFAPEDEDFKPLAFSLVDGLEKTAGLQSVGEYRWAMSRNIPDEILSVPEVLEIEEVPVVSAEGEEIDVELTDEGLEGGCLDFVRDPKYEDWDDAGEAEATEAQVKDESTWTLPHHHYQAGTLFVRSTNRGILPAAPRIYTARASYLDDQEYTLWLNNELGLVFGLKNFYHEYCLPSGAVFHLKKGEREGELILEYDGESDPHMTVQDNRLTELLALRQRAREAKFSVLDILQEIMPRHAAGARLATLFTELNVVRRTRRRMLASILSAYHCFRAKTQKEELWVYDARKVSQGMKKVKRKYLVR